MASRKKTDGGRPIPVDARAADRIHSAFEIKVAKAILDRSPSSIEALTLLGVALTKAGRHEEALEVDLQTTRILKNEPAPHYNLACSYSILDRVDEAIAELKKALDLGYRDFNHLFQDPDLKNARRDPRFRDLLQRKWGKRQP